MPSFIETMGVLTPSIHGIIISSVLLSTTISSLFAGSISDSLGRTRIIAVGALIFAIGAALEAGAVGLGMFITGRLIVGLGQGLFISVLVV